MHPQAKTGNTLLETERDKKRKRKEKKGIYHENLQGIYHEIKRKTTPLKQ